MAHDSHDPSKNEEIGDDAKFCTRSGKVACVDWSPADPEVVVSAEEALIVCWNLKQNATRYVKTGKLNPTCICCSWHEKTIVALGTKTGLVCVLDWKGDGKILYRMRGHSTEVVSLSWCPVKYNVCNPSESNNDMLLASGGKDKEVYVWRAGGDGRYELVLNLPESPVAGPHRKNSQGVIGGCVNWVAVCWVSSDILLTNSLWGELLSWNVRKAVGSDGWRSEDHRRKLWNLFHCAHLRGLFSITCLPCVEDSELGATSGEVTSPSKQCEKKHTVWTVAQDRHLIGADVHSQKIIVDIPTLGGNVYCLAVSPFDSNRIAIGVGDATIRVWNLSNRSKIDVLSFWQKINSKVTAIAWHPIEEDLIAYGTAEGRVGILNVASGAHPTVLKLYHRKTVYSLSWGANLSGGPETDGRSLLLYSCGDDEIAIYNTKKPDSAPKLLNKAVMQDADPQNKFKRTDVAWNSECNMLAAGNADGSVQVWTVPELVESRLYPHKKPIQCLAWHPVSTFTDAHYSVCRNWLAIASNETNIKVFDMSSLAEGAQRAERKPVAVLTGHLARVVSLSWSPHISGHLVSASYDGTAQVWDVRFQQPIANFSSHGDAVLSCLWSPLNPDYIITGSLDQTVTVWKVSNQTEKLPLDKKKKKKLLKSQQKEEKMLLEQNNNETWLLEDEKEEEISPAATKEETEPTSTKEVGVQYAISEKDESRKVTEATSTNEVGVEYAVSEKALCAKTNTKTVKVLGRKSHFPVSSLLRNRGRADDLTRIQKMLNGCDTEPTYFGSREALINLIDTEEEHHLKMGNYELLHEMELWKGNVTEMLKNAIETRSLTDWHVSITPMVSQRVWKDTIESYVQQLTDTGCYHKAATYLLVLHKMNEAIELLVSKKLFREALCIAKCRLSEDDPIIKKVLEEWADHLIIGGNNEHAAECLLATNNKDRLKEAVGLLARRSDPDALSVASSIARKAGDDGLADSFIKKSFCEFLLQEKWDNALEMLNDKIIEYPQLKFLTVIHKSLITMRNTFQKSPSDIVWSWLQGLLKEGSSITEKMKASCMEYFGSDYSDVSEGDCGILEKNFTVPSNSKQLWLTVSEHVFAACSSTDNKRLHHLIKALATCYQFGVSNPKDISLLQISVWLAPKGPLQDEILQASENSSTLSLVKSMRCYVVAEICRWLENISEESKIETVMNTSEVSDDKHLRKNEDSENIFEEFRSPVAPNADQGEPNRNPECTDVDKELTEEEINKNVIEATESRITDVLSVAKSESSKDLECVRVMEDTIEKDAREKIYEETEPRHTDSHSAAKKGIGEDLESLKVTQELTKKSKPTDSKKVLFGNDTCYELTVHSLVKKDLMERENSIKDVRVTEINGADGVKVARDDLMERENSIKDVRVTEINGTDGLKAAKDDQIHQMEKSEQCLENGNIFDEKDKWICISEILKQYFPDVIDHNTVKYFKDQLELREVEQELANYVSKSNKDNSDEHLKNETLLRKLNQLLEAVDSFESQRVNSPNPFISYCKMVNVCHLISERLPDTGNELLENIKSLWNSNIDDLFPSKS